MVVGSNGAIAWGFTNTEGDWIDAIPLEPVDGDPKTYRTAEGPRALEIHEETIRVRGAADETVEVEWTIWGPVAGMDHHGLRRHRAHAAITQESVDRRYVAQVLRGSLHQIGPSARCASPRQLHLQSLQAKCVF